MFQSPTTFVWPEEFTREAHSALPNAPVVPHREPRRARIQAPTRRTRIALANGLQRAATVVAPAECSPAR